MCQTSLLGHTLVLREEGGLPSAADGRRRIVLLRQDARVDDELVLELAYELGPIALHSLVHGVRETDGRAAATLGRHVAVEEQMRRIFGHLGHLVMERYELIRRRFISFRQTEKQARHTSQNISSPKMTTTLKKNFIRGKHDTVYLIAHSGTACGY